MLELIYTENQDGFDFEYHISYHEYKKICKQYGYDYDDDNLLDNNDFMDWLKSHFIHEARSAYQDDQDYARELRNDTMKTL